MGKATLNARNGVTRPGAGDAPLMPNLFVIGASKSGSSALHAYLDAHPDICMSREKEPCYFVDQAELREAWPIMARRPCSHELANYLALFEGGERAAYRGEGSVYYSQAPHRSGVAARIAAECPDARIVYVVREPVSRAVAHYWQRAKEFQEPLPLDRAVRENALYRDTSDYALQLGAYEAVFPKRQIKVIVAEEMKADRRAVLADLLDWLGVVPRSYVEEELALRHVSPPTSRRERLPMVGTLRNSWAWSRLREVLPRAAVDRLRAAGTERFDKTSVDEREARAFLVEALAEPTARFATASGLDLSLWDA